MFSNFAWSEMLIIAAVAIIVVGPKDLPGMLRSLGKSIGGMKRLAGDFQRQFNEAIKEADLDDVKELTSTKGFGPLEDARKSMEEFAQTMEAPVDTDKIEPELEAAAVEQKPKAAKKPAAKKPATSKTAAPKTAARKSANGKVPTKAAAAKKPAARKTTAKKSASHKTAEKTTAAAKSVS